MFYNNFFWREISLLYYFQNLFNSMNLMGGPWYRGGLGAEWHALFLGKEARIVTLCDGFKTPVKGLLGGFDAAPTRAYIKKKNGEIVEVRGKEVYTLEYGDEIFWYSTGGGGVGDPLERDPELVRRDVM